MYSEKKKELIQKERELIDATYREPHCAEPEDGHLLSGLHVGRNPHGANSFQTSKSTTHSQISNHSETLLYRAIYTSCHHHYFILMHLGIYIFHFEFNIPNSFWLVYV